MTALAKDTAIEDLIRELDIADPAETSVGMWDSPEGEMRVAIIHETGHVYAVPERYEAGTDPALLFRLPVEKMGVEAAIQAVERHLESGASRRGCGSAICWDAATLYLRTGERA